MLVREVRFHSVLVTTRFGDVVDNAVVVCGSFARSGGKKGSSGGE